MTKNMTELIVELYQYLFNLYCENYKKLSFYKSFYVYSMKLNVTK